MDDQDANNAIMLGRQAAEEISARRRSARARRAKDIGAGAAREGHRRGRGALKFYLVIHRSSN